MKWLPSLLLILLSIEQLRAQDNLTISGIVKDTDGYEISEASIQLMTENDTLYTVSNQKGEFSFMEVGKAKFFLRISIVGYEIWHRNFELSKADSSIFLPPIVLKRKINTLKEVVVKSKLPMVIKEDTVEYYVDQYKLREYAVVEDLLKRLPGMQVDMNGNITVMGKPIKKIRINGKDFMVNDIRDLTQLLPVDMIDKIQLINDYGALAAATGRKAREPIPVLNLQTKVGLKKIYQAQSIAGTGSEGRYTASLLGNYFSEEQRLSIKGNTNNINTGAGKVTTSTGSFTYQGKYSEALSASANLTGEHMSSKMESISTIETVTSDGTMYIDNSSLNSSINKLYNYNGRLEYKSTQQDVINLNFNGSFKDANTVNNLAAIQSGLQRKDQYTVNNIISRTSTINSELFVSHLFKKPGRALTFTLSTNYNYDDNQQDGNDSLRYYGLNNEIIKDSVLHQLLGKIDRTWGIGGQLSLIEPLGKEESLELRYEPHYMASSNSQVTQWVNDGKPDLIDSLSNHYGYHIFRQQVELNYRKNNEKIEVTLGGRISPSIMRSNNTSGTSAIVLRSSPFIPVTQIIFKLPRYARLAFSYSGNLDFPNYQQIQPVANLSNPQFPIVGNPDLRTSFLHSFFLGYYIMGVNSLSLNLSANIVKDKIVTNVVLVRDSFNTVKQETHFLNTNGNYDYRLGYNWTQQLNKGKYNLFVDGVSTYNNNIFYLDSVQKAAKTLAITHSVQANMMRNWVELMGGVFYTYNRNVYILEENNITNLSSWSFRIRSKFFFLKTFFLETSISKQLNGGYGKGVNTNPFMINSSLAQTFFKRKLTCKFQVYNLLDERANVSQSISGNTISKNRDNMLGRYFMLSLQYDLKSIQKK